MSREILLKIFLLAASLLGVGYTIWAYRRPREVSFRILLGDEKKYPVLFLTERAIKIWSIIGFLIFLSTSLLILLSFF